MNSHDSTVIASNNSEAHSKSFNNERYSDCQLHLKDGTIIHAHSIILESAITIELKPIMKVDDDAELFYMLVQAIYGLKLTITAEQLCPFIQLVKKYCFDALLVTIIPKVDTLASSGTIRDPNVSIALWELVQDPLFAISLPTIASRLRTHIKHENVVDFILKQDVQGLCLILEHVLNRDPQQSGEMIMQWVNADPQNRTNLSHSLYSFIFARPSNNEDKYKNDILYSKYFKMIQLGVPKNMVQQKMISDNINPEILEYVSHFTNSQYSNPNANPRLRLPGPPPPPPPPVPYNMPPPPPPPALADGMDGNDEEWSDDDWD